MAAGVTLDQLRDLFTGVPADDGGWSTTPCYTVALAYEIAKRADAQSEFALRTVIYDSSAPDEIPDEALEAIKEASVEYVQHRNRRLRGLLR